METYTEAEALARQAFHINKHKKIKKKLPKCNSSICFNKRRLKASIPAFFLFDVIVIYN
jgi:hypothetical protein